MVSWGGSAYGRIGGAEKWRRFDHFNGSPTAESLYLLIRGFFPPGDVARLLGMDSKEVKSALEETFGAIRMRGDNGHSDANRFHYLEMKRYLHDQLLRDADVFSMTHSIELRVPLLDDPLVEAGCRIPPREKVSSTVNKPKLVDAIGDPVVRSAAMRPKRGFVFPFATWMKANAAGFEERALAGNLLERAAVRDCWRQFRAGRLHWSRAWSTVVLAALANGPLRTRGT
jgi:asparagine synthase (glutamine-hydrolysing)